MRRHTLRSALLIGLLIAVALMATAAPALAAPADETAAASGVLATVTTNLRMRQGPSTAQPQLAVIPGGTTVEVLGRNAASNWLYVNFGGRTGWVAAWYARLNTPIGNVPVSDGTGGGAAAGAPSAAPAGGSATANVNLRMRGGPGTEFGTVGYILRGASAPVLAQQGEWVAIDHRGVQGWVAGWYVTLGSGAPQAAAPAPAPAAAAPSQQGDVTVYGDAGAMIREINRVRCQSGLPPVAENGQLNTAAREHAVEMAAGNYFSHTDPNGRSGADHLRAAGYNFRAMGENLAAGRGDVGGTFGQWMASDAHRANMLNPAYTEAGLAHVSRPGTTYGHYWVLELGARDGVGAPTCAQAGF